ncbi:MAG: hypothetical protein H0W34_05715 [Pyrinomonadaceae bacterium]|jgi:hypothetical protein|nr:hypothetical protein [Pyrinomonadaceae bacterium]
MYFTTGAGRLFFGVSDKEESRITTALAPSGKQVVGDNARALVGVRRDLLPGCSGGFF